MAPQEASPASAEKRAATNNRVRMSVHTVRLQTSTTRSAKGKPAGDRRRVAQVEYSWRCLESDPHRALQAISVTLEVLRSHTMAPSKFRADVDKRHRAPDNIPVRDAQQFVAAGASCDHVGVDGVPDGAGLECGPQIFGP